MLKRVIILFLMFLAGTFAYAKPIDVQEENGIYHITLKGNAVRKHIKFILSPNLVTNKEIHTENKSILTINTGFFDPKNGRTISYIVTDGQVTEDPMLNDNFIFNPFVREHLKEILNRTEFRIIQCEKKLKYEIVPHDTPVGNNCTITTSAQGGPMLLPELRLEEELFLVKDEDGNIIRQSASMLDRVPRTIAGIKDDEMHILIITNKNPKTIYEARDLCKSLGFEYAMAFDGGSSTSLDYKKIHVTSTQKLDTGRRLKSFMIIK